MAQTTTHVPGPTPPTTNPPSPTERTRGGGVGWLLTATGLVAAGVVLLVATSSGPPSQPAPTQTPVGGGNASTQPGAYAGWPAGVPRSADAAERWFAQQHPAPAGWPAGIPRSADAAERWFAQQHPAPAGWPAGIPRSADAAERWFANQG